MALSLDRKSFIDILENGKGDIGAAMLPPPEGQWGMPLEMVAALPGYGLDVPKSRAEAHHIMQGLGWGPDRRLAVKVSTRNTTPLVNSAVVLIDQLKEIYIDGELEPVDNALWFTKIMRHDYAVALGLTFNAVDDPDQTFYETYVCGADNNPDGYCNPEIDQLIDSQSAQLDELRRRDLVWEIERRLAEDGARPIIHHSRQATCRQPYVKGFDSMIKQRLQRLALRRPLARQVAAAARWGTENGRKPHDPEFNLRSFPPRRRADGGRARGRTPVGYPVADCVAARLAIEIFHSRVQQRLDWH
jgi:peptide/nickel transport system substrate-binding protein